MSTTDFATQNGSSVSAAAVAVPIVLILVAAIIIGILIILGYMYYRSKYQLSLVLPTTNVHVRNNHPY